ncbi:hypothetical protein ACFZBU_45765 [Embleya sp. NPDC008237]
MRIATTSFELWQRRSLRETAAIATIAAALVAVAGCGAYVGS